MNLNVHLFLTLKQKNNEEKYVKSLINISVKIFIKLLFFVQL